MVDRIPEQNKNYRVIGVDTFSNEDWVNGDYDNLKEAKQVCDEKGATMLIYYVYDKNGKYIYHNGTY